ncbi:NAD-dependent epimerase/dehydratase family protein [Streptomyces sp. CA-294286]|uniref:NAD-dependent epimerase/dehydratase family protein n=1 Tax=Streptomyces sp. CA-294286 TaxID=3240070 RepID=UPI003D943365
MTRTLVLGGTGFVGREVCGTFAAHGHDVTHVSRTPAPGLPGRPLTLDLGDIAPDALAGELDRIAPDVVVNCVGSIWGRTDAEMAPSVVAPTERLLAALALHRGRPRLVHLGSVLEYGPVAPGTTATGPDRPDTAYGRAKLAATSAVLAADPRALVLRVANVAGPGTPGISLLGQVAGRLAAWNGDPAAPVHVTLDPLRAHRDYVDVRDVADAVLAGALRPDAAGVLAIGRGEAVPVRALVDLLVSVSGVPARITERPDGAAGSADWMRVDPSAAHAALGWRARRQLADSLRDFWHECRTADEAGPAGARGRAVPA